MEDLLPVTSPPPTLNSLAEDPRVIELAEASSTDRADLDATEAEASGSARGLTRREEIIDGASELFADYGYHGASIRDIANHVGISHSGMLHHFDSKEGLLDAVIDRLEEHAQQALDQADTLAVDPTALLNNLINVWYPASPVIQLLAMLTTDAVSKDHPGRYRMSRLRRVHEHILETCFAQLAESGQLRSGIDPAFASRAFMDLVLGHAVREKTVRAMQSESQGDSPIEDLTKLLRAFLQPAT
jgi:AcrR family transcriptional regulator